LVPRSGRAPHRARRYRSPQQSQGSQSLAWCPPSGRDANGQTSQPRRPKREAPSPSVAGFLRQASDRHALRRAYWQPEPLPHATTVWSGWTLIATSGPAAAAKARNAARNCSTKTIFMALSPSPARANLPPVSHAVCDLSHTNAHDQSDQRGRVSAPSSTVHGGWKR
jgi:hypothetical protein